MKTKTTVFSLLTLLVLISSMVFQVTPAFAATQSLGGTASNGNLRMSVEDNGAMSVEQYDGSVWQENIYGVDAKGSTLCINGARWDMGGNSTWTPGGGGTAATPTGNSGGAAGSGTITTSWSTGAGLNITQLTSYTDGQQYYTIQWQITNTTGGSVDLRLFHGQDTLLAGSDSGNGWWDAALGTYGSIGVTHPTSGQKMWLQPVSEAAFNYVSENYYTARGEVNGCALSGTVTTTTHDNGYALEFRNTLGAGATWNVTIEEHFVPVTPVDTTPPVITVPANMTVEATSGSGAVVTFTATATDETAPANPAVTCVPPSGSTFPLGTTTVNCSATDTAGNTGTNSFTITVQDTTAPTLFLPADFSVLQALPGGAIVTYSATATDAVGPANPIVTCFPASGSLFPVGFTTVNCSATDTAGNTAIGKFHVTVIPNINLLKNPGFDLQVGSMYWTYNKPRVSFKTLVDCEVFISPSCSLEFTVTRKNIAELQTVTQTVSVPLGQAGDQYSWGIYSQANFLPAAGTYQVNLSFVNNLGKTVGTQTMVFATGVTDWQLYNSMFTAPASYVKIIYKLTFQKKSFSDWSAYLDDAFLYSMGNTR